MKIEKNINSFYNIPPATKYVVEFVTNFEKCISTSQTWARIFIKILSIFNITK